MNLIERVRKFEKWACKKLFGEEAAEILTEKVYLPAPPRGALTLAALTAVVVALASCRSPNNRVYFKTRGECNESYAELAELLGGESKFGKNKTNSIDWYVEHGNTETNRKHMPNLKTAYDEAKAGLNQAINLGNDTYLVPGLGILAKQTHYSGGNSPDEKYALMPGAQLTIVSPMFNIFFRYNEGKGEYEFRGLEESYRELNVFLKANAKLGKGWEIGAEFEQWRQNFAKVGLIDHRDISIFLKKALSPKFDITFGVKATDTNMNPGKNYDPSIGPALEAHYRIKENMRAVLGVQYLPNTDDTNAPGFGVFGGIEVGGFW